MKNALVEIPCLPVSVFSPQYMYAPDDISFVYGRRGARLSPTLAAFVNGVAVSINRWNTFVTMEPRTPDYFSCTKFITTNRPCYSQQWYIQSGQEGLMKIFDWSFQLDFHPCLASSSLEVIRVKSSFLC